MFNDFNNKSFYMLLHRFTSACFHVFFLNTMVLEHSDLNMSTTCYKQIPMDDNTVVIMVNRRGLKNILFILEKLKLKL
jgi:hypothetical protein